ncbi:DUF459 domain-containing protein [Salinibius halmophilus]|uniref:DUF459 domain-containing protein n=1 Tax=Salinibius halmophilus TaxID=1853216 RepID=UPI0018F589EE|nr:GDSL-type esterase/lipase family protein [Salinibius halmophilus]
MQKDIRICFIGDSFVAGVGDEQALGWSGRLCREANLASSQVTYYNLGIRRNTSVDVLNRWQAECEPRLPGSCDGRIVFSFGVNDTSIEDGQPRVAFDASVLAMQKVLTAAKAYSPILVGPPAVANSAQNGRIELLSKAYKQAASEMSVPFIELYSHLSQDQAYQESVANFDGSHPRQAGYNKMASIIAESGKG